MFLPQSVAGCMEALEQAGFEAYAVGGCVRDSLLGIIPHDYDLCTNAMPEDTCRIFSDCNLVRSGEKHGTIGVVTADGVIEITTFRTEGDYQDGRHPGWVRFVPTIEEDLSRRDFTVNAMAYSRRTGLVDPWGGQADLTAKILRTVGDPTVRFTEDALRILRGVRFAVRFDLTPQEETLDAMFRLAPLMDNLARERVFDELCKILVRITSRDLLRYVPILAQVIPELAPCVGFQQHSPYHAYDVFTHISHVVENTPPELPLRWAALLHDIGKPPCFSQDETGRGHFLGHAQVGSEIADTILLRLKAPTALRHQVVFLISHHMTPIEADKRLLLRRLSRYGTDQLLSLVNLQEADMSSKGTGLPCLSHFPLVRGMVEDILAEGSCLRLKDLAIDGKDLMTLGFHPGPELGKCLQALLNQVLDGTLPNEKEVLLQKAGEHLSEVTV